MYLDIRLHFSSERRLAGELQSFSTQEKKGKVASTPPLARGKYYL